MRNQSSNYENNNRENGEDWPDVEAEDQILNDRVPEKMKERSARERERAFKHNLHVVE